MEKLVEGSEGLLSPSSSRPERSGPLVEAFTRPGKGRELLGTSWNP